MPQCVGQIEELVLCVNRHPGGSLQGAVLPTWIQKPEKLAARIENVNASPLRVGYIDLVLRIDRNTHR
jgi:hypothetical protein